MGPDYIEKINKTEIMPARTGKQNRTLTWWKSYTELIKETMQFSKHTVIV